MNKSMIDDRLVIITPNISYQSSDSIDTHLNLLKNPKAGIYVHRLCKTCSGITPNAALKCARSIISCPCTVKYQRLSWRRAKIIRYST